MTRKQIALIIAVNALVSALITSLLVLVIFPALGAAIPTATPTTPSSVAERSTPSVVAPTSEPTVHVVQAGDTISGLALRYDVPEQDIIAANNLQNPNFLQVGAELIIPTGGLSEATATFTPAPTATDTPIPFEPPSAEMTATAAAEAGAPITPGPTLPSTGELQIAISEILAAGHVEQEQVIISNNGARLADMQGWTLTDASGNVYTFPNFRLWAGGNVLVHTRIGQDGTPPANFYWGKLEAVWSAGEVATLKDENGETLSTYTVSP
jgi:LysM repeat protein